MSTLTRTRPGNNDRWSGSDAFHIKPTLEQGVDNWLGEEWQKAMLEKEGRSTEKSKYGNYKEKRFPSVFEIMAGI